MKYTQPFDQPSLPDASYVNGNPATGSQGSIPPAGCFENHQREIANFITDNSIVPLNTDLHQLSRSVQSGVVCFGLDTGLANAMSAVLIPNPPALFPGMTVRIKKSSSANTGPTTLSVGTGAHAVKRANGADVASGDLPANTVAEFIFDGTFWQVTNFQGFSATNTTVNNFTYTEQYVADTGVVNAMVATFSPAITTLTAGLRIKVKCLNTNTGPTTIAVNATGAKAVIRTTGIALMANDIRAGQVLSLIYDGTSFQTYVCSPYVWNFDIASPPGTMTLLPGECGIVRFTSVTTLDFHVGLSPGTYGVELVINSNNSIDCNCYLRPNGLVYSGKISTWSFLAGVDDSNSRPSIAPFVGEDAAIDSAYQDDSFWWDVFGGPSDNPSDPNDKGPFTMHWDICTVAPNKMIRAISGITGGPAIHWSIWNDATVWSTLGKFFIQWGPGGVNDPATMTGRAFIERLT